MSIYDDLERLRPWAESQSSPLVRDLLGKLGRELHRRDVEIARLRAGLPDGVTAEEWDIIRELRAATPPPGDPHE